MTSSVPATPDLAAAWRRFSDALRVFLRRRTRQAADADDLLQQVFLKMAAAPPQDVPEERIGAWLYRVARNALVDAHRRARLRASAPLDPEVLAASEDQEIHDLAQCLAPMLNALPASYAEALRATDLEGRTQRDLADELGLSHSAVKSRVQRARVMLRDKLIECCGADEAARCDCDPER